METNSHAAFENGGGGLQVPPPIRAKIMVRNERKVIGAYVLRWGERLIVGRGRDANIRLEDAAISRRHATLELGSDGLTLTDNHSSNGCYVQGRRVTAGVPTRVEELVVVLGGHELHGRITKARSTTNLFTLPHLPKEEFEILGEIGCGSVGRVWAARQKLLGRTVAIKMLRSDVGLDTVDKERFLREARLFTQVKSPYVVNVYDVRTTKDGNYFLVMELVQGPSASSRIKLGAMEVPEALKIGEEVGQALVALTQAGIVHRDVKPSNILICEETGVAKLGDLGIAKQLGAPALTESDMGLGTLPYVAPEQAISAKRVDGRVDIYSLGATIFHLMAGRPPLNLRGPLTLRLRTILDEPPPTLSSLVPDCPEEVSQLIDEMLSKNPSDRPSNVGELAKRLAELREEHFPDYLARSKETRVVRMRRKPRD